MNAFALSRILVLRLQRLARSYVEYLMLSSNSWPRSLGIRGVPIRCRLRTQNEQDSDCCAPSVLTLVVIPHML